MIRQQIDVNVGVPHESHDYHVISLLLHPQVINATIATEDSSEISVKLLDCDSISQAKEKVLDALYKVSQHPS